MDFSTLGRISIPGPAPAGQDARYDPDYAQLQAEIDKLSSIDRASEVEWPRVVDLAATLLSDKSKDLLAAAYLAVGLLQTQGTPGLLTGVHVLNDLVALHWEDCFPPRIRLRGRMNAFSWWQEKTLVWMKIHSTESSVPVGLRAELIASVKTLDQGLAGLLPDLPSMRELLNYLERLPVEAASESVDDSDPSSLGGEILNQAPLTTASPPGDTKAAGITLVEASRNFASIGRVEDPTDPWPWKASRLAAWLNIKTLPPATAEQTMIPAPETAIKGALRTLLVEGKLLEVCRVAEEYFPGAIFWLDLQCIICKALAGLGDDYRQALAAVGMEAHLLVKRLPGIEHLTFADGTPFADAETCAWLTTLTGEQSSNQSHGPLVQDQSLDDFLAQADRKFAGNDEAGALDLLSQALLQAPDGPSRVRLRLGQIKLLCRSGRFPMALALSDELLLEVQVRNLESWTPALVLEILTAGREVLVGLGGEDNLARAKELVARISRIRPAVALPLAL